MDNKLIKKYEKTYKIITLIYWICMFMSIGAALILIAQNKMLWVGICLPILYLGSKLLRTICYRIAIYNKINAKFTNDFDIKFLLNAFETFTQNKKRPDYRFVLFNYLNNLMIAGEFDEFKKVYLENRYYIQKSFEKSDLDTFLKFFLPLSNDEQRQKESLFQYVYSPYHTKKGKLSLVASYLRERDILQELSQRYFLKEYESIIEKVTELEKENFGNNYIKLLIQSTKERSLYHMGKEYHTPDEKQCQIFAGFRWKYLIDTGKEYRYDGAEEIIELLDQDMEQRGGQNNGKLH